MSLLVCLSVRFCVTVHAEQLALIKFYLNVGELRFPAPPYFKILLRGVLMVELQSIEVFIVTTSFTLTSEVIDGFYFIATPLNLNFQSSARFADSVSSAECGHRKLLLARPCASLFSICSLCSPGSVVWSLKWHTFNAEFSCIEVSPFSSYPHGWRDALLALYAQPYLGDWRGHEPLLHHTHVRPQSFRRGAATAIGIAPCDRSTVRGLLARFPLYK